MKFKKIAAAIAAAATAIAPLSADRLSVFVPSAVYAAEHAMGAALPDWIPDSFESALGFRNTYGATLVKDGLVCVVFKESMAGTSDDEQQGASRYEIRTTEGMMKELKRETYCSESSETGSCYEVAVYYAPEKQGEFAVALTDKWIQICIMPEDGYDPVMENNALAQKAGIDLGGVNASAFYSFAVDEDKEITETDIYGWLPDCAAEYEAYKEKNGAVSAKDDLVLFCIDKAIGTAYSWTSAVDEDMFRELFRSSCSVETAKVLDGGTQRFVAVYRALNSGKGIIRWDFARGADAGVPLVEKAIVADCTVADNGNKLTLSDSYLSDARLTFSSYSIYSGELKYSANEIYDKYYGSDSAVITSKEELDKFLSRYLNESAAKKFTEQYSELFFENYVLMLNTYLDPYRGRVFKHGLRDVVKKDGYLEIDYTSVISGVLMRTSDFDILRVEIPKEQYDGSYVVWNDNEILESDLVRIKVVDIDTGKTIEIPNDDVLSLFGGTVKYCEGSNPYYWDTERTGKTVHDLYIDEKYLPEGYELYTWNEAIIDEYPYNTADIVFNVQKNGSGTTFMDKIATTVRGINYEKMTESGPAVVTSEEELQEIMSSWFTNESLQRKVMSKYGDEFFKGNVLFLDWEVDSTGGSGVSIRNMEISDGNISVYYIERSPDYGICNTDYLCILQATVPKSKYHGEKVEWKCLGDVNGDNVFGIADLLTLQKWLKGSDDVSMPDWTRADLCRDGRIDVFDLCMLRKQLISCDNGNLTNPRSYDYKMNVVVHYNGYGYAGNWIEKDDEYMDFSISEGDKFTEKQEGKWVKNDSDDLNYIIEVVKITDDGIRVKKCQYGETSFEILPLGRVLSLESMHGSSDSANYSYDVSFSREYRYPIYGIDYDYRH